MASTIKVNNIQNQCGANIINESANTITIGASGDTIQLAAGASQSGFGRSGSVNWDTTAKTASFTAVSGNGYFVNTTSGAITVTLPASPSAGDIVAINDYARTFATNIVTVARNGSLIQGIATDGTISTNGQSTTFVYVDGTKGWVPTEDQTTGNYGSLYITATGGTITTCGNYKIHTFTSPGTFCVSCAGNCAGSNSVDYLVVAGGAGGGRGDAPDGAGGGGAGGFRLSNSTCMPAPLTSPLATPTALPVTATGYPITVGGGGAGSNCSTVPAGAGSNSIFSSITSAGGGRGGNYFPFNCGGPGGSGGGAHQAAGGNGNTPPVSPPQGNNGGAAGAPSPSGSGGGGAGAIGNVSGCGGTTNGGPGGIGSYVVSAGFAGCNGTTGPVSSTRYFAGGGGGSNSPGRSPIGAIGTGGAGGGANQCAAGTANTGGGGGGGAAGNGGAGGSGIVIIRYKYQ